jgi:hypothetical protein
VPSAHGIDEHIRGLEVRGDIRMSHLPSLQPGQRILLASRAGDLDQWVHRHATT